VSARVVAVNVAPVKALGLVHPQEIHLNERGVDGDRRFWLVDEERRLFNNKRCGPLVRVRPEWDEATGVLALAFPDGARVEGVVEVEAEPFAVELYGYPLASRRVVGPWAEALSEFAGQPLTLLRADEGAPDRLYAGGASIVSRASLAEVAARGGERGPLDGRRFRMLLELDGVQAHEEDAWLGRRVRVGDALLQVNGDVGRCAVTTHDPDTGVPDFDTLKVLAAYRREGVKEPLPLGVYASVVEPGRVRVGDALTIS
jgi:uncharacterized protein YcbX